MTFFYCFFNKKKQLLLLLYIININIAVKIGYLLCLLFDKLPKAKNKNTDSIFMSFSLREC